MRRHLDSKLDEKARTALALLNKKYAEVRVVDPYGDAAVPIEQIMRHVFGKPLDNESPEFAKVRGLLIDPRFFAH